MASEVKRLKEDLLSLPVESRASLAAVLTESLGETLDDDAASLWLEEIGRRDARFRAGSATPKPVDQVMREARAIFGWKSFRERET
jgi:Putative addiction module component